MFPAKMTSKVEKGGLEEMNREQTRSSLIPAHGGYRRLKSFQVAQLVYDVTVRFCDRYVEKRSRTHDQMVQAARSGVQNIAEGSQASGTSKKTDSSSPMWLAPVLRNCVWIMRTSCGSAGWRCGRRTTRP